jgi:hypothetical protein
MLLITSSMLVAMENNKKQWNPEKHLKKLKQEEEQTAQEVDRVKDIIKNIKENIKEKTEKLLEKKLQPSSSKPILKITNSWQAFADVGIALTLGFTTLCYTVCYYDQSLKSKLILYAGFASSFLILFRNTIFGYFKPKQTIKKR